jgi:hypothetical protein
MRSFVRLVASAVLAGGLSGLAGLAAAPSQRAARWDAALARGLDCVSRHFDGRSFRDPYLEYVYEGESLGSAVGGRVTYRLLDAYFIALMIRQAGVPAGRAGPLFERAEKVTADLVPRWRRERIYNLRSNPGPGGVALDTYAILAVLRRDAAMGRVVEAGLDRDGWLAHDLYPRDEAFRRLADESWAARACLVADGDQGEAILVAACRRASEAADAETDPIAGANLVIHTLEGLADAPSSAPGLLEHSREQGRALLDKPEIRKDTLTFANLIGAMSLVAAKSGDERARLAAGVDELVARQRQDGSWLATEDSPDTSGSIFATLRLVLTTARASRAGLAAAP